MRSFLFSASLLCGCQLVSGLSDLHEAGGRPGGGGAGTGGAGSGASNVGGASGAGDVGGAGGAGGETCLAGAQGGCSTSAPGCPGMCVSTSTCALHCDSNPSGFCADESMQNHPMSCGAESDADCEIFCASPYCDNGVAGINNVGQSLHVACMGAGACKGVIACTGPCTVDCGMGGCVDVTVNCADGYPCTVSCDPSSTVTVNGAGPCVDKSNCQGS